MTRDTVTVDVDPYIRDWSDRGSVSCGSPVEEGAPFFQRYELGYESLLVGAPEVRHLSKTRTKVRM